MGWCLEEIEAWPPFFLLQSWMELDRAGPVSVLFKSKRIQHEERPEAAKGNGS